MSRKQYIRILIIVFIIVAFLSFYRLPYYVYSPGSAMELAPIIDVEGSTSEEEGSFMLTTVSRMEPNIIVYLWAKTRPFYDIVDQEKVRDEGETEEEFNLLQLYLMDNSKSNAIQVAFDHARIPYELDYHGVYILGIIEGMPAEKVFQPGDQIIKVDDVEFESSGEFISYVEQTNAPIKVSFIRDGESKTTTITKAPFPNNPEKKGFGISLVDDYDIITKPAVEIDTSTIGGPSAGLMFSLEIYNQLTETDWTKGYEIAGTGEITPDGKVLRIGGIDHKIVAADEEGADIFFAPNEEGREGSNYKEALKIKEQIDSDMIIVPVDTFEDAIEYLQTLKDEGE